MLIFYSHEISWYSLVCFESLELKLEGICTGSSAAAKVICWPLGTSPTPTVLNNPLEQESGNVLWARFLHYKQVMPSCWNSSCILCFLAVLVEYDWLASMLWHILVSCQNAKIPSMYQRPDLVLQSVKHSAWDVVEHSMDYSKRRDTSLAISKHSKQWKKTHLEQKQKQKSMI